MKQKITRFIAQLEKHDAAKRAYFETMKLVLDYKKQQSKRA